MSAMYGVLALTASLATLVVASGDTCAELTRLSKRVDTNVKYSGDDDGAFVFAGNRGKSLYKQRCQYEPCDYTFECVLELGFLALNEISNGGPLQVSEIRPSTNRLEGPLDSLGWSWPATSEGAPMLPRDALVGLKVHTPGKSDVAIQADYTSWKSFYQEKGRTQIFRLFEGTYNVRNANRGMSAGRSEAYSDDSWRYRNTGKKNKWYVFQALYTIVDPQDAHIFQVFSSDKRNGKVMAWTVTLSMLADGRIVYLERGHGISDDDCVGLDVPCDTEQRLTVKSVTDITLGRGGQFALCVRDDGFVTETWALHGDALHESAGAICGESPWQLLGRYEGDARRRQNKAYDWKYRWGTYVQSKKTLEPSVVNECKDSLVFVSGVNMKKVLKSN